MTRLLPIIVVLAVATACARHTSRVPEDMVFGTLGSLASSAAAESAAGVHGATVELEWSAYEPAPGAFSAAYAATIRERMRAFQAAGQQLTLALGVHHSPAWVRELPGAIAADQYGTRLPGIDMVFSRAVRDAAAAYFARVGADLGLHNFAYVRLTSGGNAEMLYNTRGSYAAFSAAAQRESPLPGWRPGGREASRAQVRAWADWYVGALAGVTRWQIARFDAFGFTGVYQAITPGSGVRPDAYADAVASFLPDGLLGIGGAWHRYYAALAGTPRLMVYVSSVGDGSGSDDSCTPADRQVPIDSPAAGPWSATRWLSRLADEYGFRKGGENPGYGDTSAAAYADQSDGGLLASAVRQAVDCHFDVFNFAHAEQLVRGPLTLDAYAARIRWARDRRSG
ncbi:hypothetical protein [Actinoplanes sp. RD1]|uniref:hypothetical protein n=1 Tax=Actinoplanes sp. RD1 TaxID=3064538 RepID=UPI0027424F3C|nr:hypothetical protein [Actinoplanes sp. RD1]